MWYTLLQESLLEGCIAWLFFLQKSRSSDFLFNFKKMIPYFIKSLEPLDEYFIFSILRKYSVCDLVRKDRWVCIFPLM